MSWPFKDGLTDAQIFDLKNRDLADAVAYFVLQAKPVRDEKDGIGFDAWRLHNLTFARDLFQPQSDPKYFSMVMISVTLRYGEFTIFAVDLDSDWRRNSATAFYNPRAYVRVKSRNLIVEGLIFDAFCKLALMLSIRDDVPILADPPEQIFSAFADR